VRTQSKIGLFLAVTSFVIGLSALNARAFSLLGPYELWMEETNGLRQPGSIYLPSYYPASLEPADIGGPMCISNEYRWNVPVVTYGFDKSFLDYFGTNGVAAVEGAIQILNTLPPVSQIALSNFPLDSQQVNYTAQAQNLLDLKSTTLSLLLEQMGLAQPTRHVFVLKQWTSALIPPDSNGYSSALYWEDWAIPDFIVQRNFDPQTFNASPYVNDTLYTADIVFESNGQNYMETFPVDPLAPSYPAVADENWVSGGFYTGLTYDDVGGLCYLLSTNNVNCEALLPGVFGVGTNANSFVNGAWRPGVDKITFVPQSVDSLTGAFLPMTNQFADTYITNGILMQQQLARVISQPDFLFSAKDFKEITSSPDVSRTGTTNWINNAALNGNPTGAGPGVIQPPITIAFNIAGRQFWHDGSMPDESVYDETFLWGTFDGSANAPVVYPVPSTGTNQMTFRMLLQMGSYSSGIQRNFEWPLDSSAGSLYNFQTSTNLSNWVTLFVVTNNGAVCDFFNWNPSSAQRFYRIVPQ
jgi:hypothetical protein